MQITLGGGGIAVAITAALTIVGGVYVLGKDVGQQDLAVYKSANEIGLPELNKSLTAAAKSITADLASYNENKHLKADLDTKGAQIAAQSAKLAQMERAAKDAEARNADLSQQLAKLLGQRRTFELREGQGEELLPGLYVGFMGTSSNEASIVLDNKPVKEPVGSVSRVDRAGKQCSLALKRLEMFSATFEFACE